MKYKDNRIKKEVEPQVGDFIYGNGNIYVIVRHISEYGIICLTGVSKGLGTCTTKISIEELVDHYKFVYDDFELIKSDELELIRR